MSSSRYIFFTGGFDSAAILVNYYLYRDYTITPIYIRDEWIDDGGLGKSQRRSHQQEMDCIEQITQRLIQDFPQYKHKLKELMIVGKVKYCQQVKQYSDEVYRLRLAHRPVNQFTSMAQVCRDLNINADVGVIYDGTFYKTRMLDRILAFGTDDCRFNLEICESFLQLYQNLRFPIAHLTKLDILALAKNQGWLDYLNLSWSCWFPTRQGKPCGKCNMCKERVIPHRSSSRPGC